MNRIAASLVLIVSLAVKADSIADEADFRFRRAAQLYKKGDVEEALSEFLASNRLVRNRNVLFNIARCFEQLKMHNEAYRWYVELLGERDLPDADRPAIHAALARLRPHLALLEVASDPQGATVFVDRKDLGARGLTPLTLALPPGKATAILELAGFRPAQAKADLVVGKTAHVQLPLERIWGHLALDLQPAGIELRLDRTDSEPIAVDNGQARVLPGDHSVFASAPGFLPEQKKIFVPPDGTAAVEFKLAPLRKPTGRVVVRASVDGALVKIDGKEMGFTPGVIESVETGEHVLSITAENREPFQRRIKVTQGERTFVDAHLRYEQSRVVAAQKQLTTAQDAPASITVIEADEIRAFGYQTLAEALSSVRGLYTSSDRDYDSLGVRGFSTPGTYNNRVLVLSDGHVTNDVAIGQGFIGRDFSPDLSDVERIEIVRGPGSVLYGSAAFFAVVNVVHRQPDQGKHAEAGGSIGTLGENVGHAQLSAAGEPGFVNLRVSGANLFGEPIFAAPDSGGFAAGLDGETALHADLRARVGEGLTLLASYNQRKKDIPTAPFNTLFGQPGTTTTDRRGFVELAFTRTGSSGFGIDARASYDAYRYKGTWAYADPTAPRGFTPGHDSNDSDWIEGELRLRLPEVARNRFFVGGDAQYRMRMNLGSVNDDTNPSASGSFFKDTDERIVSAYAGDDLRLSRRVALSAAVRLDDHLDSFGLAVNPRFALLLAPYADGHMKLLFGRAFRAPSLYERYFNDGGNSQVAAGTLAPEQIWTAEIEHVHQVSDEVSLTGAVFWSFMQDLIIPAEVSPRVFQFQNELGTAHSAGAEMEARWRPGRGALFSLWYAFNRTASPSGEILPNSPQHTGAARLLYPIAGELLSFSTELMYGSPRHTLADGADPDTLVGEALRWNLGLSGEYPRWRVRYGAHVFNVLDQKPLQPAGLEIAFPSHAVPQLGRTLRLSAAATF